MATSSLQAVYAAKLGMVTISTGNSALDGTGPLGTVITASTGAQGTFVKSVIVKAQTDTSEGMIRLFTNKTGSPTNLLKEIKVDPINKSSRDSSFFVSIPINYTLEPGEILRASTENSDTFNVIAEAFEITYLSNTTFVDTSVQFTSAAGINKVVAANPNLNGTGTVVTIITAGPVTGSWQGCSINSIMVKALQTTTPGMIRLFIKDAAGGTPVLFCELEVPIVVQTGTTTSFAINAVSHGSLCIPADYSIIASTEKAEQFAITAEGANWKNI